MVMRNSLEKKGILLAPLSTQAENGTSSLKKCERKKSYTLV
jgi:lambda repressor-like predicted transcriptional regulator